MTARDTLIDDFLARSGWGGAARAKLAGDASFRRYERITLSAQKAVLMDAPPEKEDVRPFIAVDELLCGWGFSAPRILFQDIANGLLLLEDLGDDLYSRVLKVKPELEMPLYEAAIDALSALRGRSASVIPAKAGILPTHTTKGKAEDLRFRGDDKENTIPPYDEALMLREVGLFAEWFLPQCAEADALPELQASFAALWKPLLAGVKDARETLVLRDYHADNLLWLPEREGVARVGQLDFQDAVYGHGAYDLVSLLEDARRDVERATVEAMKERYIAKTGVNRQDFLRDYAILGAQRNCKIVGIFVRLGVRDGKTQYTHFLPRVWGHVMTDLKHPALAPLAKWMEAHVPERFRGAITLDTARKSA